MKFEILLILTITATALSNKQVLFSNSSSIKLESLFNKFIAKYEKGYTTEKLIERFLIFSENVILHAKHLLLEEDPQFSPFLDMTTQEFEKKFLRFKKPETDNYGVHVNNNLEAAPLSFDYRTVGAVTPVKNQGECGSCWAFSTTGNIEGQYAIKRKTLLGFSEQQLIDCNNNSDNCDGGLMTRAFRSILSNGGIMSDADYKYTGTDHNKCKFDLSKVKAKLLGYNFVRGGEESVKQALFENGPLSVAMNAKTLQFYFGGVLESSPAQCDPNDINHAVLLVGYGTENGKDFWIFKNSWGRSSGEAGYFRALRNREKNICGIYTEISTAVLANN